MAKFNFSDIEKKYDEFVSKYKDYESIMKYKTLKPNLCLISNDVFYNFICNPDYETYIKLDENNNKVICSGSIEVPIVIVKDPDVFKFVLE
jgi:hypothetical protein